MKTIGQIIRQSDRKSSQITSTTSWAIAIRNTFGDKVNFLTLFTPDKQKIICTNPRTCFTGNYPVLSRIKETYGEETATSWLNIQINDLSEYAGVKKLDIRQNEELASTILAFYSYMTVAELMLFFFKFKAGEYGKFYGSVDPLVISEALLDFKAERAKAYADIEKERINKESEKYHNVPNKVTYEEYLKLKQQADNGDKHAKQLLQK